MQLGHKRRLMSTNLHWDHKMQLCMRGTSTLPEQNVQKKTNEPLIIYLNLLTYLIT